MKSNKLWHYYSRWPLPTLTLRCKAVAALKKSDWKTFSSVIKTSYISGEERGDRALRGGIFPALLQGEWEMNKVT